MRGADARQECKVQLWLPPGRPSSERCEVLCFASHVFALSEADSWRRAGPPSPAKAAHRPVSFRGAPAPPPTASEARKARDRRAASVEPEGKRESERLPRRSASAEPSARPKLHSGRRRAAPLATVNLPGRKK